MPYANNKGINIFYEIEGSGPELILAHGFSSTGEDWRELGYVAQLNEDYRLILVDARGHGKSDKPHAPEAYSPEARVGDYLAILDSLGISKAHYWGYSSGGVVGMCAAKYAPDRFNSIIIGGLNPYQNNRDIGDKTSPSDKPMKGLPDANDPIRNLLDNGGKAWLNFWESNVQVPEGMKSRLGDNDFSALIALWEQPYNWRAEIETFIPKYPFPCLLYVGEGEANNYKGMKTCAEEMPHAEFVALPECGHFDIWLNIDQIIPYAKQFLGRLKG